MNQTCELHTGLTPKIKCPNPYHTNLKKIHIRFHPNPTTSYPNKTKLIRWRGVYIYIKKHYPARDVSRKNKKNPSHSDRFLNPSPWKKASKKKKASLGWCSLFSQEFNEHGVISLSPAGKGFRPRSERIAVKKGFGTERKKWEKGVTVHWPEPAETERIAPCSSSGVGEAKKWRRVKRGKCHRTFCPLPFFPAFSNIAQHLSKGEELGMGTPGSEVKIGEWILWGRGFKGLGTYKKAFSNLFKPDPVLTLSDLDFFWCRNS